MEKSVLNDMSELWSLLADSFWQILLPGLTMTIPLTAISFSLAMVIAIAVALVQFAKIPVLKELCRSYIWVIRGTPLLVQLFVVFYGLPHVGILIDPFPTAVIVFSINEGAYCAETVRAALESVPAGQLEAAECAGLSWGQSIRRIVLPQALRIAFPSLSHRDGDVYGHYPDRRPDLAVPASLSGGGIHILDILHRADQAAKRWREKAECL